MHLALDFDSLFFFFFEMGFVGFTEDAHVLHGGVSFVSEFHYLGAHGLELFHLGFDLLFLAFDDFFKFIFDQFLSINLIHAFIQQMKLVLINFLLIILYLSLRLLFMQLIFQLI